jgi:glyoxylase-like metal-dependent hydrolase (beta-lactamase superfamily II)
MQQIQAWKIDMQRVKYLFVGHSHFDHCGAVPFLQKRYPHLQVLASKQSAKYFTMPKAVNNARTFGRQALEQMGASNEFEGVSLDFDTIRVKRVLQDGDHVDLGRGMVASVFETPGHSRCAMTLYLKAQKWLFPSDALSLPLDGGEQFACTASESFVDYMNSLDRMDALEVELCAWEHYGLMTGEHARRIVSRVKQSTLAYKRMLKTHVEQSGDGEATAKWAAREWLAQTQFKFIPFNVMQHICRQMVQNAVKEKLTDED